MGTSHPFSGLQGKRRHPAAVAAAGLATATARIAALTRITAVASIASIASIGAMALMAATGPAAAMAAAPSAGAGGARPAETAAIPPATEGDCTIQGFRFDSGESLPALRLHYRTLGKPQRDARGRVSNAVLIMHGTTGSGQNFMNEQFAGRLFGAGQLLDAARYYLILPDDIGTGNSSRPSEGLHMRFPHYGYNDMVRAEHHLVSQCLGVDHLRLVMGTSMGAMHTWMWGYMYPDAMDALLPLASLPIEISGRNRMLRKMFMDSITSDPQWKNGEYASQPPGLTAAVHVFLFMVSSPLEWQKEAPTRAIADVFLAERIKHYLDLLDANDALYQFDASRDYNPLPHLAEIRAPLYAVNSADDQVNPPELGIMDLAIRRVPHGRYILLPITDQTRGHGTHSLPAIWGSYLGELLAASQAPAPAAKPAPAAAPPGGHGR